VKNGLVFRFKEGHTTKKIEPVEHRQHKGLGEVEQFTKDGTFVAKYRNSTEAEKVTGIAGVSVRKCIHGTAKTAGGYSWKLAE
jgi:hypothetical protein